MSRTGGGTWTVVYDGECRICTRSVNILRDWDRHARFELLAYQGTGVQERFDTVSVEEFESSVQLIGPDGGRWEGADAVEKILELVPRTRLFAWLFRIPLVRPIARFVYRFIARHRRFFGCGDHCPVV